VTVLTVYPLAEDVEEDLDLAAGAASPCSASACGYHSHTFAWITRQRYGEYIHFGHPSFWLGIAIENACLLALQVLRFNRVLNN
jgi:hypothetical protein